MAQSLENDIAWFEKEIAVYKSTIAKVDRGAGTAKQAVLEGLRATLRSHERSLAELLEKRNRGG